tara:strand:- start:395 stop:568 length:174 start_codon:yes stop_codon:yes gene_type:complete
MKSEINENSKNLINEKLFLKYVSYNTSNKKDSKKTIAFSNFFNKNGDRIFNSKVKSD